MEFDEIIETWHFMKSTFNPSASSCRRKTIKIRGRPFFSASTGKALLWSLFASVIVVADAVAMYKVYNSNVIHVQKREHFYKYKKTKQKEKHDSVKKTTQKQKEEESQSLKDLRSDTVKVWYCRSNTWKEYLDILLLARNLSALRSKLSNCTLTAHTWCTFLNSDMYHICKKAHPGPVD